MILRALLALASSLLLVADLSAADPVPVLLTRLHSKYSSDREAAAYALGAYKQRSQEVIPELIKSISDSDKDVRYESAISLVELGSTDPAVLAVVKEMFLDWNDPRNFGRCTGFSERAGAKRDALVPIVLDMLKGNHESGVALAIHVILNIGPAAAPAVPLLIKKIDNPASSIRRSAVMALGVIGPKAREAVPRLERLLTTDPWPVVLQGCGIMALTFAGPPADLSVPIAIYHLQLERTGLKLAAGGALVAIDPHDKAIRQFLKQVKANTREVDRMLVLLLLRDAHPTTEGLLEGVCAVVKDANESPRVRKSAVRAVGGFDGAVRRRAISSLTIALQSSHQDLQVEAARVLIQIDAGMATDLLPLLTQYLQSTDSNVRQESAKLLGQIGPPAKVALPALAKALKDSSPGVVRDAAVALIKMDSTNPDAIPALIDQFGYQDDFGFIPILAIHALEELGPKAAAAEPALMKLLEGVSSVHVRRAGRALARIQGN